ncbi:hypothetical protein BH20VER3_BH20VER3_08040 [soil metagenome]
MQRTAATVFSAVLLAGGKSSRMGRDKAFLEIAGQPLWRRQIETLSRLSPEQLMISGPSRTAWSAYENAPDQHANGGPLAGVAAALQQCRTAHLLVLAVDLARMTSDYLASLLQLCPRHQGIVPQGGGRFEPLAAIYPAACRALAEANLHVGDYSMQNFVRRARERGLVLERPISNAEIPLFANLNTPADL